MNAVFTALMIICSAALLITDPASLLPALSEGAKKGLDTAIALFVIYAVWMGLSEVAEESRLTARISALIKKPITAIFRTKDEAAAEDIAMNVSCNLLGIGGAATPYAVRAIDRLEKQQNHFAQNLLFIINATSIQLFPATVIAIRSSAGSSAAYDIALPSLLATAISTGCAVCLFLISERLSGRKKP